MRQQTYRRFEVIAQDGGSTDGSIEFLASVRDLPKIDIASQPDSGIGQAYNRGIARSRGDLVCTTACDDCFDHNALEKVVGWFRERPQAAAIYAATRLADADGQIKQVFFPPHFELHGLIRNEIVPPMDAAFLNRAVLGNELRLDESLKTCPDYDFWIRVGRRFGKDAIAMIPEPILVARSDRASMSYRAESFDLFCADKMRVLERHLPALAPEETREQFRKSAAAGIFTWAAESVYGLEGASPRFLTWCAKAAALDPNSARLTELQRRTRSFEIDADSGQFLTVPSQAEEPCGPTNLVEGLIQLHDIYTLPHWADANVSHNDTIQIVTAAQPWSYAAIIPLQKAPELRKDCWYWVRLRGQVISGQIGVAVYEGGELGHEKILTTANGPSDVFLKIKPQEAEGVLIRNGSFPGSSVMEISDVWLESGPKR